MRRRSEGQLRRCTRGVRRPGPRRGGGDVSSVQIARARVAGDSLIGEEGVPPQRRAFALREVTRVEGRRVSPLRTLGLGWLALNAAAGVLLLVFLAS